MKNGFIVGVMLGIATLAVVWEVSKPGIISSIGAYVQQNWQAQLDPQLASVLQAVGGQSAVNLIANAITTTLTQKLP